LYEKIPKLSPKNPESYPHNSQLYINLC